MADKIKLLNTVPRQVLNENTSSVTMLTELQVNAALATINANLTASINDLATSTAQQITDLTNQLTQAVTNITNTYDPQIATINDRLLTLETSLNDVTEQRIQDIETLIGPWATNYTDQDIVTWAMSVDVSVADYSGRIGALEYFRTQQKYSNTEFTTDIQNIQSTLGATNNVISTHISNTSNPHQVTLQQTFDIQTLPAITKQPIFYSSDGQMDWSKRLPTLDEVNALLQGNSAGGAYAGQILFLIDGVDFNTPGQLPLATSINDTPLAGKMFYNKSDDSVWEYSAVNTGGGIPVGSGFWVPNTTLVSTFTTGTWIDCVHYYGLWHGVSYRGEVPARMTRNASGTMDPIVYFDKIVEGSITTVDIANGAITTAKIADQSITYSKFYTAGDTNKRPGSIPWHLGAKDANNSWTEGPIYWTNPPHFSTAVKQVLTINQYVDSNTATAFGAPSWWTLETLFTDLTIDATQIQYDYLIKLRGSNSTLQLMPISSMTWTENNIFAATIDKTYDRVLIVGKNTNNAVWASKMPVGMLQSGTGLNPNYMKAITYGNTGFADVDWRVPTCIKAVSIGYTPNNVSSFRFKFNIAAEYNAIGAISYSMLIQWFSDNSINTGKRAIPCLFEIHYNSNPNTPTIYLGNIYLYSTNNLRVVYFDFEVQSMQEVMLPDKNNFDIMWNSDVVAYPLGY